MFNSRLLARIVVAAAVVLAAHQAHAQRKPAAMPKEDVSSAGEVVAIQQGMFHVKNVGGDEWLIRVQAPREDIVLKATAYPSWLRPGMPVEFRGLYRTNKDGKPLGPAREPIAKLKVFSPRGGMPSIANGPAVAGSAGVTKAPKKGSFLVGTKPKEEAPPEDTTAYTVKGVLKSYKLGRMTVLSGQHTYLAELAADASISVDIADVRWARVGDEMEFEGWHLPGREKYVNATKVWIKAVKPLGTPSSPRGSSTAPSAQQRRAVNEIQVALTKAGKLYQEMKIEQAAEVVEKIQADMDKLVSAGNPSVIALLEPKFIHIKRLHAILQLEGGMLPELKELNVPK